MAKIQSIVFGTAFAAITAIGLSLIGTLEIASNAFVQENAQLGHLVDLLVRKGFKDTDGGQFCGLFQIKGRVGDGKCMLFSLQADDDDLKDTGYQKGWYPSFESFVELGSGQTRIIFVTHRVSSEKKIPTGSGYAFLTAVNGSLQKAVLGSKKEWSMALVRDRH